MASINKTFKIGGDLEVNRLGYGAMRLTGAGSGASPKIPTRRNVFLSAPSSAG